MNNKENFWQIFESGLDLSHQLYNGAIWSQFFTDSRITGDLKNLKKMIKDQDNWEEPPERYWRNLENKIMLEIEKK